MTSHNYRLTLNTPDLIIYLYCALGLLQNSQHLCHHLCLKKKKVLSVLEVCMHDKCYTRCSRVWVFVFFGTQVCENTEANISIKFWVCLSISNFMKWPEWHDYLKMTSSAAVREGKQFVFFSKYKCFILVRVVLEPELIPGILGVMSEYILDGRPVRARAT